LTASMNRSSTTRTSLSRAVRPGHRGRLCLLALSFCLAAFAATAGDEHDFVGVAKCKTCHKKDGIGNQIAAWEDTKHAKAYETLASDQAKKWAEEAGVGDPQTADECVKCHVTAHGVPEDRVSVKFDKTLGVQCESCHGAGKDYRKKKIMIDQDAAIAKGLVPQSEKVCVTCHNDESPAWKDDRYTKADGSKVGFDYEQAVKAIAHPVPEGYDPMADGEAD
jgi:hypothetical protein